MSDIYVMEDWGLDLNPEADAELSNGRGEDEDDEQ